MEDQITEIYFGTLVEAEFLASVLRDNGIPYLIRDIEKESRVAGWVANLISKDTCKVFVFEKDKVRALNLLKEIKDAPFEQQ